MALLKSLTDNGLTYAEISIKSGIRASKFSDLKRGKSSVTKADWEKLNAAYGEGAKDPMEEMNEQMEEMRKQLAELNKMQKQFMNELLNANPLDQTRQKEIVEQLKEGGIVDQTFAKMAQEHGISIKAVKTIFFEELEKLKKEQDNK